MATKLIYLEDFDVVTCTSQVLKVTQTEDNKDVIEVDQTCFYPRGGGQDWDTGTISNDQAVFEVSEVRLDENGNVHHIGRFVKGSFSPGETVKCEVEARRRQINTRLHSAGHLIDMAMSNLRPDWVPVKGGHYPHMSFVEYAIPEGTELTESFAAKLQTLANNLAQSGYTNQIRFMPKNEMARYCRHVPDNIPANKPSRIVLYADDFGIPCGGTHVKSVGGIGEVSIPKVKVKKGLAKVSYAVKGIN